ncbi:hypothetical protein PCK1_001427 [Pneumocystis canis]|nr:hypothetical protein PCK1_001427 [Pneumocystis canis]
MKKEKIDLNEIKNTENIINLMNHEEIIPKKEEFLIIDENYEKPIYNKNENLIEMKDLDESKGFEGVFKVLDQAIIEKEVFTKANLKIIELDIIHECKTLKRLDAEKVKLLKKIQKIEEKVAKNNCFDLGVKDKENISNFNNQLFEVQKDIRKISKRIEELISKKEKYEEGLTPFEEPFRETDKEYQIRIGKITPFSNISGLERQINIETENNLPVLCDSISHEKDSYAFQSLDQNDKVDFVSQEFLKHGKHYLKDSDDQIENSQNDFTEISKTLITENDLFINDTIESSENNADEYIKKDEQDDSFQNFSCIDDGDEKYYQESIPIKKARIRYNMMRQEPEICTGLDEWFCPHPSIEDYKFEGDYSLPGDLRSKLFNYQKTCIQWLWELHCQGTGGIIADEMGLGKTIQIIGFLGGLHYSQKLSGPILVVCPATIMKQWVNEFHKWWPPFRVVILHTIGSGLINIKHEKELEKHIEDDKLSRNILFKLIAVKRIKKIVDKIKTLGHVLIITYSGLRIYKEFIFPNEWAYCILDEGHKIRNPDSDISFICKQIKTPHRIILSGTPIQNNLDELWSLFDFIFPGYLGTLPIFQSQFAIPINIGGYVNASNIQIQTAYKCACVLRDLISPYFLRRMKADVASDLPNKNEQVLFCRLTTFQKEAYQSFLNSKDMELILKGEKQILYGIDILRKICNHPDLVHRETFIKKNDMKYGDPKKSGKMQVVKEILKLWKSQGHRTLLFAQTKQMLDILEKFIKEMDQFNYCRMDGGTNISSRQSLVDKFNNSNDIDIFLLTTRVGGLGLNLTGANRVIIFDPDWNPSTDVQAQERVWRLGQKKEVIIYRLMTSNTIEEKIYHRQIFKQFLTNKILKDPKQRRFFKAANLYDLFSLKSDDFYGTETGEMFIGTERIYNKVKSSLSDSENKNVDDNEKLKSITGVTKLEKFTIKSVLYEKNDEFQILEDILAKSGVCSALQHDAIMNSSSQEALLVEKEATRISENAIKILKASRKEIQKSDSGILLRTRKFVEPSQINFRKKLNLSVSPLKMENTNNFENKINDMKNSCDFSTDKSVKLIKSICDFIIMKGGKVSSADIVEKFGTSVNGSQQVMQFKKLLKEIARWENKLWVLKEDFL